MMDGLSAGMSCADRLLAGQIKAQSQCHKSGQRSLLPSTAKSMDNKSPAQVHMQYRIA